MLRIIPYPCVLTKKDSYLEWDGTFRPADSVDFDTALLEPFCQRTRSLIDGSSSTTLDMKQDTSLAPEEYRLDIDRSSITVTASTKQGIIWGLTTAALLYQFKKKRFVCCHVEDKPYYDHRGLLLDSARHFFPAAEVKKIIEEISLCKMNVFHWHLSDDQGWRIESKRFPELNKVSGPCYSQDEIREIDAFAAQRGVEIIPEIDMPGHMTALLAAYPQYSCSGKKVELAQKGGVYRTILCPGKEETFTMLQQLLEEIVPLFSSQRFHIGGDEAPKSEWKSCPSCAARMKEEGLTSYDQLQGYFTNRVADILKSLSRQPICWNESLKADNLSPVTIQYWTPAGRKDVDRFANSKGQVIYSNKFDFYFDYPYSMTSLERVYETKPQLKAKPFGIECAVWTEHITYSKQLEEHLFPRVQAVAELSWKGPRSRFAYKNFEKRLDAYFALPLHKTLTPCPKEDWNPKGKTRLGQSLAYMHIMTGSLETDTDTADQESYSVSPAFTHSFITKFFRLSDLPTLMRLLKGMKK